jgi:hypothetical protein
MTITAKRMFTALIALGMLGIGTAFATANKNDVPYSNDFESVSWPNGTLATNLNTTPNGQTWFSTTDDLSMITNSPSGAGYTTTSQWATAHTKVLQLNTQGAILTNNLNNGDATSGDGIYLDTMVQFVASDSTPQACTTNDTNIKAAVFANSSSNLVIYHGELGPLLGFGSNVVEVITGKVLNASTWYRVTIRYKDHTGGGNEEALFQVKVDGVLITSTNAYPDNWWTYMDSNTGALPPKNPAGTWFPGATFGTRTVITAVAFQGTGYIDDLLVTPSDPLFTQGGPTFWYLNVTGGGVGGTVVPGVGTSYPVPVGNSTNVHAYTLPWYRLAMTTNGYQIASGATNVNPTIASLAQNLTNTVAVTFTPMTGQLSYTNVPVSWVSNYYNEAQALADPNLGMDYMLNQNPTNNYTATLTITSIAVAGDTNVAVGVQLGGTGLTLGTKLNGNLEMLGTSNLTSAWTLVTASVSSNTQFNASGNVTNTFVDALTPEFFKATIVPNYP